MQGSTELNLNELRDMASRQQQQIEMQQQMLVAKQQRLKFLKQQEVKHQVSNNIGGQRSHHGVKGYCIIPLLPPPPIIKTVLVSVIFTCDLDVMEIGPF